MGIKSGSGKGSVDRSGERMGPVSGVGSRRKKQQQLPPPPPKKPLPPVENPFPEKQGFRLGQYQVVEERDDYLICTGYDPNAKNPASEVTPSAFRSGVLMKVAKPPALQRTVWEAGPITINGVEYTYNYSSNGIRTAHWTEDDEDLSEVQKIDIPYVVDGIGDILVAVQIKKNAAVEGMEITDEEGTRLRWMDLNISGRHWTGQGAEADDDGNVFDAELTEALSHASDPKTGSNTATAKFLIADPDNPGDLMDGEEFTVTNRSRDLDGDEGDYIIVRRIGTEWRIIWIDC